MIEDPETKESKCQRTSCLQDYSCRPSHFGALLNPYSNSPKDEANDTPLPKATGKKNVEIVDMRHCEHEWCECVCVDSKGEEIITEDRIVLRAVEKKCDLVAEVEELPGCSGYTADVLALLDPDANASSNEGNVSSLEESSGTFKCSGYHPPETPTPDPDR